MTLNLALYDSDEKRFKRFQEVTWNGAILGISGDIWVNYGTFNNDIKTLARIRIKNTNATYTNISGNGTINQDIKLPATLGTPGQALVTDGAGNLSWGSVQTVTVTNYDFDISSGGTYGVVIGESLTNKAHQVFRNGVLYRQGVSGGYTLNTTTLPNDTISFDQALPLNSWVRVSVFPTAFNISDFDVGVGGQSLFTSIYSLTGKSVQVYVNGVNQRQGVSNDYTISGNDIVFGRTIPQNAWVRIIVF